MPLRSLIRHARPILLLLLLAACLPHVSAYTLPFSPFPKIEVNGNNTLSFNLNSVKGSRSYYGDDNADRDQTFTQSSNLYLTGELYKDLFLNATVQADRYSPDDINWNLRYNGNDAKVLLGEFTANLGANEFVTLNRSLTGVQVDAVLPRGDLTLVGSRLKSPVRTDTFYGENTSGPYYLTASPIVDGSEVVTVNGVRKKHTTDYTLDITSGILNFTAGNIISPADKVTVSYEVASGDLSSGGNLYAVRAAYPLNDHLTMGLTHLQVQGGSGGATQRDERDTYLGTGTPGPYYLTKRPIVPDSETITFNGVLVPRIAGDGVTAYTLDNLTGSLLFAKGYEPPVNSTVIVRYKVEVAGAADGNRSVTGLDFDWQLGNGLTLNLQAATSSDPAKTLKGSNAYALGANYRDEKLTASARLRSVGAGFAPLESVGYRNVDRDLQWSLSYKASDELRLTSTGNTARLPLNPYVERSADDILMDETNHTFSVEYTKPNWPQIVLSRAVQNAARVDSNDLGNDTTTDSLRVIVNREHLNGTLELSRVKSDSRQLTDLSNPTSPVYTYRGTTDNAVLNLQYQPNDRFDAGLNLAANRVKADGSNGAIDTSGRNAQVNANYRASRNLTFSSALSLNQTGSTRAANGTVNDAIKDRNAYLSANWTASDRLNVGLTYNNSRTEGGNYSNSKSDNLTANANYQVNDKVALNGYWTRQNLNYTDTQGSTVSNMVGASADVGPIGKVKVKLDAQHLWGESSYGVSQLLASEGEAHRSVPTRVVDGTTANVTGNKLTTLAARVSYPLTKRQEVYVTAETTQSSGFPSKSSKNSVGLGWNYHLNDNLTFTVDAGRVQYTDDENANLDYSANQLNAQLSWNF